MSTPEAKGPAADDLFNPYRAPEASADPAKGGPTADLAILAHWERLRVAYNLILAAEVMALSLGALSLGALPGGRRFLNLLMMLPIYALAANVCFCAGPVATAYARWIGLRERPASFVLFGLGTLLAVLATAVTVSLHLYPFPNVD